MPNNPVNIVVTFYASVSIESSKTSVYIAKETITISDLFGHTLMIKDTSVPYIGIEALPQGIYFVHIGKSVWKLIKK